MFLDYSCSPGQLSALPATVRGAPNSPLVRIAVVGRRCSWSARGCGPPPDASHPWPVPGKPSAVASPQAPRLAQHSGGPPAAHPVGSVPHRLAE